VLLAGPDGQPWCDATPTLPLEDAPAITAYRVAGDGGLVPELDFFELCGIKSDGAVLVRPDGHVAYRARNLVLDPSAELASALLRILHRAD
jgi:putative polyketide hydroxylase